MGIDDEFNIYEELQLDSIVAQALNALAEGEGGAPVEGEGSVSSVVAKETSPAVPAPGDIDSSKKISFHFLFMGL